MAQEEKEEGEEKKEAGGGGKKKLIIIIAAVVILIGVGVGAFLALGGKKAPEGEEGEEEAAAEEGAEEGGEGEHGELAGAIMPLETFIVNLGVKGSFLKVTINLEFSDPELPKTAENDVPKIRDSIIRVLSKKRADEILAADGKDKARDEIKDAVNQTLGTEDVVGVYFSEFIVQ